MCSPQVHVPYLPLKYQTRLERFAEDKRSSLFGLFVSDEGKKFYGIDTRCQCYKTFFLRFR
jgi:hypothetical protein